MIYRFNPPSFLLLYVVQLRSTVRGNPVFPGISNRAVQQGYGKQKQMDILLFFFFFVYNP